MTSREDWMKALDGQDAVIHLAAETGTGQSMYEIEKYVNTNIGGTALLLDILTVCVIGASIGRHCVIGANSVVTQ